MSLLGIDIGSSSCKGVVFSVYSGQELAIQSQCYPTVRTDPGRAEMDAAVFRDAVFSIIQQLSEQVTDDPIEGIAISSHGETIIPVDINGNATGPAIMNSDNRAVAEAQRWHTTFGREQIYAITGLPLHAMFSLNKIMWIKQHDPALYARSDKFLSVGDYILVQLGLPAYTDYSLASRTMAFDIRNLRWSDEILDHCGIPKEKLAIPVPAGTIAGNLSAVIAATLALKEGTVIALGGHDQPCGALGAGAIEAGDIADSAGTYECMTAVSDQPMNSKTALGYSLNSYCHVVPGKFVTLAFFPAGLVSSWFTEQFCYEDKLTAQQTGMNVYEVLAENSLKFCPGPSGLCITPHFVGSCNPSWDVRATGVMAGLTPDISRYHIYKAIYEGIACELALNVTALEQILGVFDTMSINGGNAGSTFTVQLRADITGKTISILQTNEAVCLGAAMLAGLSIGVYKDAGDAVGKLVKIKSKIVPDPGMKQAYQKQLERYQTLYPSLERYRAI